MSVQLSIAIVGGGLGGLSTAIALRRHGFDVHVFERAAALGEVGAGINISPQATKALFGMGLEADLATVGTRVTGMIQRSMYSGEQLVETDLGAASDRFGAPYYVFHRADLLNALVRAIEPERLHLGHACESVEQSDDGATAIFQNGKRHRADIIIGADGIHSRVRHALYGGESPTFTGQMVWRALLDGSAFPRDILGPHGFLGWIGKGCHIMTYYLRGTSIINITTQSDAEAWVAEGWSIRGDPEDMRAAFPNAAPELQRILDGVTECSKWGLFGRQPSSDWGHGRIQLIGDAAHPMLPNAGQGAAQAFEDAYVLARWLDAKRADPIGALEAFRNVRIPRAHAIQRQSLANSKLVHAGDWEQRLETFRKRESQGDTPLGMNWIYGYDPARQWCEREEYPLSTEQPAS